MNALTIDKKEELVMRLTHYFITKENYSPIIVSGAKNEVWLENINGPYKIVRINSNYIHNNEQLEKDIYKTKNIVTQIKRKTLSFKMNTLNIFLDANERVNPYNDKNISTIFVENIKDVKKSEVINDAFPDISSNMLSEEKGIDLIINVTNDINEKTSKTNRTYDKVFRPKKIIITYVLIALCVLMYMLQMAMPNVTYFLANKLELVKSGEVWRLITSAFIHSPTSIAHILCNMYSLYIIGSQLEGFLGKAKFIFIYLISALTGSLLSIMFNSGYSLGASGAIFGLMGSLLYFGYNYRLYLSNVVKSQIVPIIVLNLALGFMTPGIDNFAHIGGLVGGYLSTMALGVDDRASKTEKTNGWIVLTLLVTFCIFFILKFR